MQYYRVDTSRFSWTECWRLSPGFGFLVLGGLKLFNMGLPVPVAIHSPPCLVPMTVDGVPPGARRGFDRVLAALPLEPAFYYTTMNLMNGEACACVFRSQDPRIVGQVLYSRTPEMEKCVLGFMSRLQDGTLVVTARQKRETNSPPNISTEHHPDVDPPALWKAHEAHLARRARRSPAQALEDLAEVVLENERRGVDFNVKRGVYRPMDEREVQGLREQLGRLPEAD